MPTSLTKAFLEKVYTEQGLSTWAIEKKYGFTRSSVYNALKRYEIPTRSIATSHMRYPRADFSEDLIEKAYLIGFAIVDLRVRRHNKSRSETISIGCGSTKKAQILLFENLFSKYGRVWKGVPDKRGAVNIEAFVNYSFSFLLPDQRLYDWTLSSENTFFSFLAGFTDAEGSFYLTRDQARVSWGNYNKEVLEFIRSGLNIFGIEAPSLYCDTLQGYIGSHGYRRNENYCHVTCTKKVVIIALLDKFEQFLHHEEKLKKACEIRANILERNTKYGK